MKNRDFFEILNSLDSKEGKVFTALDKLSQNKGYVYASYRYLGEKTELEEQEVKEIVSMLIKKGDVFYLKTENQFIIFTEKYKFYNYLKKMGNKKEKGSSVRAAVTLTEEKNTIEDEELQKAVEEAYNNLNEVELFELYDEAEEKYKRELNVPYRDNQKKYFELLKEVYMKLILKERIKNERIN